MALNTSVFQEPRGVMRILQFIFAICAFATVTDYSSSVQITYCAPANSTTVHIPFSYPFKLDRVSTPMKCPNDAEREFILGGDFSQDSQFFVATGVLSFLYCIGIIVVYGLFEDVYQSNALIPMGDFILTVLLAVFWLSGSAAWSNGIIGLKGVIEPQSILARKECLELSCQSVLIGSFSSLDVSAILGFLNFFLWASDLWFLYKETQWFKNVNPAPEGSSPTALA